MEQALARLQTADLANASLRHELDVLVRDVTLYREMLPTIVRSLRISQRLPHDLPAFCFGGPDYPTLTEAEQAMIAGSASPGLLRMRDVLRLAQERNEDLSSRNYFLRSNIDDAYERIDHLESTISRLRGGPDYTERLERAVRGLHHMTEPYCYGPDPPPMEMREVLRQLHYHSDLWAIQIPYL